ncbi:dipeptidase [Brevibacillus agri]|uniref:dipeptidase n=1 Tax=Brevibacillus agri TaxID=51101 RepID=UPI00046E6562|nr:membrane dipeptidase [Brevibacillus agri]MBG9565772.1 dipeptidase [Brevibacillus agri]WHX28609.1 membrane dipeptidase [Brevibacillus agri]
MKIFDAHCDVLGKLWKEPERDFYKEDDFLQAGFPALAKGNVDIQVLACFVPVHVPYGRRFHTILEMIDIFYEKVASEQFRPIYTMADLDERVLKGEKGAILFVEGAHALEESLVQLRTWYRLGVRGMTLTWNHGNCVADGSGEPNPGGLTAFGRQVIEEMNRLGMVIDVSHLADPGFWDVMDLSSAAAYSQLLEALLRHYKEAEVLKFVQGNWLRVFGNVLQ